MAQTTVSRVLMTRILEQVSPFLETQAAGRDILYSALRDDSPDLRNLPLEGTTEGFVRAMDAR